MAVQEPNQNTQIFSSPDQLQQEADSQLTPPKKLPIKPILLGLGILVLLTLLFFVLRQFLGRIAAPEEAKLVYWGLWEDTPVVEGVIKEYEAQNQNVKITYIKQSKEDYRERLENSLARGNGPDIFRYHNTWVPMFSTHLSSLPPEVMNAADYQQVFYPVASDTLRNGANIVGIPLMFDGLALYINEDIFTSEGKTPPITWDELRTLARQLTIKDEAGRIERSGAALGITSNVDHWQDILALMLLQNGASFSNPTGQLAEDALAFFTIFTSSDKIWDESLPSSTQAFAAGKLAMYFGPSWRAFEIKRANPSLRFKTVPVPQLPKATSGTTNITWASFWAEGVWNNSKHKEEAWKFLSYLASKEVLQKMYREASKTRLFGEIYPRQDMANLLQSDPIVGPFVAQAPNAESWYLTSRTFDGPTGVNSRISAYYEDAINAINKNNARASEVLPTVAQGVAQVLQSYGVTR